MLTVTNLNVININDFYKLIDKQDRDTILARLWYSHFILHSQSKYPKDKYHICLIETVIKIIMRPDYPKYMHILDRYTLNINNETKQACEKYLMTLPHNTYAMFIFDNTDTISSSVSG